MQIASEMLMLIMMLIMVCITMMMMMMMTSIMSRRRGGSLLKCGVAVAPVAKWQLYGPHSYHYLYGHFSYDFSSSFRYTIVIICDDNNSRMMMNFYHSFCSDSAYTERFMGLYHNIIIYLF